MGASAQAARAGYEEFNRQDFDALLARVAPDSQWHEAPEIPGRKSCRDREEFARYIRGFEQLWDDFDFDPQELKETGPDTVYARVILRGRGKASAHDMELEIHHVWRLRAGLFASMNAYLDESEARSAAGLVPAD